MENTNSRWIILFILMNVISLFLFPKIGHASTNWLSYFRKDSMLNTYKRAYAVLDDVLWVGTFGDGVKIVDGKNTRFLTSKNTRSNQKRDDGLISDYITSIAIDEKNGRVWIGTNAGLSACNLKGEEWQRFKISDGLPNDVIRDIVLDSRQNVWVATSLGVAKYDGKKWETFNEKNGILQSSVRSLHVQGDSVWVGTIGGTVSRYSDGEWKTYMSF